MAATSQQWLELHRRCLDTVRAVLDGLNDRQLRVQEPTFGQSVGSEVEHIIGAETYWLREVRIQPQFVCPARDEWSAAGFRQALDGIEAQYAEVLKERPGDQDVLFGLGRVCQHALNHRNRMVFLRRRQQPEWEPPPAYRIGSWERAVDYLTELLMGIEPREHGE